MKFNTVTLITSALLFLFSTVSFPQDFRKITAGVIVNDGGDSWGCSWGDFDNDGYVDLFVTNLDSDVPENHFLYQNNGDGSFTRVNQGQIVNEGGAFSSSWGDFDNDGDLDIVVLNSGSQFFPAPNTSLYANSGDGTFEEITEGFGFNTATSLSSSWADYDNDGHLDLFIADASSTKSNTLLHNNGDGSFAEITEGDLVNDVFRAGGCSWADFDNDGNTDLFVANRVGNNFLYHNNGKGSFVKITEGPIVNDGAPSYSGSWADFDNDGDLDLFVTNSGNFGNFLYINNSDGTFTKIVKGDIVGDKGTCYSSSWGDFDNDGDLDLFVSNANPQSNFMYSNNGDGTFTKITQGAIVTDIGASAGCSWSDFDNNGSLDLFVSNFNSENNFLYANNGNANNWINIKCVGVVSNKSAIGARVMVKAHIEGASFWQMREISGQTGLFAQNSLNAEFGLGDATMIDSIMVKWPASGIVDVLIDIPANQFLTVTEGSGTTSVNGQKPLPESFELFQNYPNPFNPSTTISYFVPHSGFVTLRIYDVLGREVKVLFNGVQTAGRHKIIFDAGPLPSGIYFYKLRVNPSSASSGEPSIQTKKMLYLR